MITTKIQKNEKTTLTEIIFYKSFKTKARTNFSNAYLKVLLCYRDWHEETTVLQTNKKKDPLKIFSKKMTDNLLLLPNDNKYVILASETGVQRLSKSCFEIRWETPLIESCFQYSFTQTCNFTKVAFYYKFSLVSFTKFFRAAYSQNTFVHLFFWIYKYKTYNQW